MNKGFKKFEGNIKVHVYEDGNIWQQMMDLALGVKIDEDPKYFCDYCTQNNNSITIKDCRTDGKDVNLTIGYSDSIFYIEWGDETSSKVKYSNEDFFKIKYLYDGDKNGK